MTVDKDRFLNDKDYEKFFDLTTKLSNFIDYNFNNAINAITKNGKIILLGDYNINYLDKLERSKLEPVKLPYDCMSTTKIPNPLKRANNTESLIDLIITHSLIPLSLTAHTFHHTFHYHTFHYHTFHYHRLLTYKRHC